MYITEEQFDETIERAFTRGMEFQKKNQKDLETIWFDIGYNAGLKIAKLNQGDCDDLQ
jgi:hypothetical protein